MSASAFSRQCVSRAASVSERVSDVGSKGAIDWIEMQKAESHLCGSQPIKTMTSWRLILRLLADAQLERQKSKIVQRSFDPSGPNIERTGRRRGRDDY